MELKRDTLLERGKYRIIETLGRGGFGITYLAEQVMTKRKVCIKEFFPKDYYKRDGDTNNISVASEGFAESMRRFKAKFIKEAQIIASLDHAHIIHIHDVFEENGTAYYVMEYIEGESLSDLVKRSGALVEAEAVRYIRSVAEALGYIHERKIMHLDVKPANVMLNSEDDQVVVIDFGLSKQYDEEGHQTSSTPVGISAGFAPMEQYQQGGVKEFSPETDIYSLGATLYYLVTGHVPPQAVCVADEGLPELPAHLSSGVRNAIERSMTFQRKHRPHSAKEFLALLEDNTPEVVAIPTPKPTPSPVSAPVSAPVADKTSVAASAPVADERAVVGAPAHTAQPIPQSKKEWAPKYSAEKPKKSEETKKKSKWWLWLLIVAVVAIGGYLALSGSKESEATKSQQVQKRQAEETEKARIAEEKGQAEDIVKARVAEEKPKAKEVKPVAPKQKIQPNNEIWYTSSDGKVVKPYKEDKDIFGAEVVSNTYEGGKGIIKFNGDVTTVGMLAFYQCGSLTCVTIPNSVTTIGYHAFSGCKSLTSVTIPDSVTTIGDIAFENCFSLTSVTIPNSVTTIGEWAFIGCNSLKEFKGKYVADGGRCLIKDNTIIAYANASGTTYDIPNSVKAIGNGAFDGCSNLTSVTIPNSVTTIGDNAFFCCESLTSVTIPNSVTTIGEDAFGICKKLSEETKNKIKSINPDALW